MIKGILLPTLVVLLLSCSGPKGTYEPSEEDMRAYLLVYFKDSDHSLHMALSTDGYAFTDVNQGNSVIAGDTIARQKGIRDPHIMRGPNNLFYLTMTDLHIYAKKAGFREDEWERPRETYGWGNNKGFVLMRSADLIHWEHTSVAIDQFFQGYDSIGCAWAPQTIWDDEKDLPMIYYSMRYKDGRIGLFYTYANKEFTELVSKPQLLYEYPKEVSYIDGDITKVGDKYHLFYVPHDGTPGVKQAVSTNLTSGYAYDSVWYDSEEVRVEAPNIWKRIGEDKWVLMYDIYGLKPANFGFRETTDFINFTDLGRFNEGVMKATNFEVPKHGAVIPIAKGEAARLSSHWGLDLTF